MALSKTVRVKRTTSLCLSSASDTRRNHHQNLSLAVELVQCTSLNKMAPRKKKATKECKQTRATKRRSSKVNTNKPLGTSHIHPTDTATQPLVEQAMSTDSLTASSSQKPGEFTLRARLLHKLADSVDRSNPGIHDERCSVQHRPPLLLVC